MSKIILMLSFLFVTNLSFAQKSIYVKFEHTANDKSIKLDTTQFVNYFGERYTISKLKYYISNLQFDNMTSIIQYKNIQLIDASKNDSFKILLPKKNISGIKFQLGVDSILNCSGAQSGALDPLNDMFWTWNSGYVNFKLEGKSDSSKAVNNKIEQHIGGYKGNFKAMRNIFIPLPNNFFVGKKTITIKVNIDNYWSSNNKISIAQNPVIASPGELAAKAADNFKQMFTIHYAK